MVDTTFKDSIVGSVRSAGEKTHGLITDDAVIPVVDSGTLKNTTYANLVTQIKNALG